MSVQAFPVTASECISSISSLVVNETPVEEILDFVYESSSSFIPYDRIGWAEIRQDKDLVSARWTRASTRVLLRCGFSAKLSTSSLFFVMQQRKPRIMDDLAKYLESRPQSRSTSLILREGIRSSLTCPLFVGATSLGFLFFSSYEPNVYSKENCPFAMDVAKLVALRIHAVNSLGCVVPALPSEVAAPTRYPIDSLKPGMVIGEALRSKGRSLLLASGHTLSSHSIDRLRQMAKAGEIDFVDIEIAKL